MKKITAPPTVEKVKHYKEIACREFVPDVRDVKYDYDFVKGELVPVNTRLCQGMGLDRPYDSKKYQLKSKIIYFYGDQDPVTPKEQLAYHFNHQRSTRTLITVHGGGHTALSTNLSDCFSALWVSFLHKTEIPLKDCALKTTIKNAK